LKEQLDSLNNLKKGRGRAGKQAPPQKRRPLFRLRRVVRKAMSKADGINVDPRVPPRKGFSNCICQRAAIEKLKRGRIRHKPVRVKFVNHL
jgi:hypothetical protein